MAPCAATFGTKPFWRSSCRQPVRSLDFLVRALLSVALYELEDERTPEYAIVDAAVQTAKATDAHRASGLINAVLRRYLRERKALDLEIARRPDTRHAAPIWLADRFRADWPVRWTQLLAASDVQAPMWLRVNSRLTTAAGYLEELRSAGIFARAEERVPYAIVLESPCEVHELPGFAAGRVSVQDLGAQCVAFPIGSREGSARTGCLRRAGRQNRADRGTGTRLRETRGGRHRSAAPGARARKLEPGRFACRDHCRRFGQPKELVGRRAVRSNSARRALFRARRDSPPSRYPIA